MDHSLLLTYAIAIINSVLAGVFTGYYISTKNIIYLFGAVLCNAFLIFNYTTIFAINGMAKGYACIKISSMVCIAIYGGMFLHENINMYSIIGIGMGACSIMLLNMK